MPAPKSRLAALATSLGGSPFGPYEHHLEQTQK